MLIRVFACDEALEILITKCKIYTEKWGNDESPQGGPRGFSSRDVKFTLRNGGMMRVRNEVPGNFSSRNVKFTQGNGGMMRVRKEAPGISHHGM